MAINLGSGTVSKLYLGSTEITKAYLGSTEVYNAGTPATNDAFELTVETTAANESFLLPMQGVTSIDVDWGDGTVDTGITSDNPTHTYATAGTHSISVTGSAVVVLFNGSGSEGKLRTVTNLGALGWNNFNNAFRNCSSMTSFICGDTDTSSVTDMVAMFLSCTSLSTIDVSQFDTSNVTSMASMFNGTRPTVLDVSNFDVSNVTNMNRLFRSVRAATLDVSQWNMSSVQNIGEMFVGCSFLENLDIDGWDVTSVTNGGDFLSGANLALTTAQYDAVLIAWAAQSVQSNVTIHFGDAQYTAGGAAETARNTLVSTYGWTITDGGSA